MNMLDNALRLLEAGYSVIPLWPKSKQAMIRWTEFQKRVPTESEVRAWWEREPEANVGIVTGAVSRVVVLDVDPRNGGDAEQVFLDAPSSFRVSTPGGGVHLYYLHPGGRVQKGKPRQGVDLQADGCYVVAPGSFVVTDRYSGTYDLLSEGVPAALPSWVHAPGGSTAPEQRDQGWVSRTLVHGCPAGTRNDTLTRLAGYLARKDLPEDVSAALLWRWVREQDGTHVTQQECLRTVQSIYAKEQRGEGDGSYVVDEFRENRSGPLEVEELSAFIPKFYSEKVEWLIPGWLPDKTVAFLVSPPGHFKTMLTFDVAISVAGGWPFLGQVPVQNPGSVLVIQQEDSYGDMARRFNAIFAARTPKRSVASGGIATGAVDGHLYVADYPPVYICTTRGFTLTHDNLRRLEDLVRRLRPRVVIIDPLYSITSAEDFMMCAAKDMLPLKRLRDSYGATFVLAAHTKKGADPDREGLWGSQFLNAFLETGWQIRDVQDGEPNQVQILRHFKSAAPEGPTKVEFLLNSDDGYEVILSDPDDVTMEKDPVLSYLRYVYPVVMTAAQISLAKGLKEKSVHSRLEKLREKALVIKIDAPFEREVAWSVAPDTLAGVIDGHPGVA